MPGKTLGFACIFFFFGSKLKFGKTQTFSEQFGVTRLLFWEKKLKNKTRKEKEAHLKMWNYFV